MKIGDAAAAVDGRAVGALVLTAIVVGAAGVCVSAMMSAFMPPPVRHTTATASATATPPRNGSIRTWQADGHWWVVGDGWGVHHPACPCHAKAEVE